MSEKITCKICQAEAHICEHIMAQIANLATANATQAAELKALSNTWKGILKVLDLEHANSSTIFLKIPGLIAKIQRNPEMFNFISPELTAIIDKHAD